MAHRITKLEDHLFARLAQQKDFSDGLYRDGAPSPERYDAQEFKVVFVFRDPNLEGRNFDHDMRAEIRNARGNDMGRRRGWWRGKVGAFAHAVASPPGCDAEQRFEQFCRVRDTGDLSAPPEHLRACAFIQLKKRGGAGVQHAGEVYYFARRYKDVLAEQLAIYDPHLLVGCGRGASAPAELIHELVLPGHFGERRETSNGLTWRPAQSLATKPMALLSYSHSSARTSRRQLYTELACASSEIRRALSMMEPGLADTAGGKASPG